LTTPAWELLTVGKFWSLLFLLVPVLGVLCFVYGWWVNIWLPVDISEHGHTIDHLFFFITALTGVVFVGTEVALFWFMWKYDKAINTAPVKFTHGSHSLEVVWTIIPAATLLFIAIYQLNAWAEVKLESHMPKIAPTVQVTARQFEWRLQYPGKDNLIGTKDDIHVVNDLHLPLNEDILIELKSMDVLHSFFLPNMRVKQDAVPGMRIPVWFRATKEGVYDLVCAELCGWGHYKMRGRLTIESRAKYDEWLDKMYAQQEATHETQSVATTQ
jgi:cytochrome c oxidase subunit II